MVGNGAVNLQAISQQAANMERLKIEVIIGTAQGLYAEYIKSHTILEKDMLDVNELRKAANNAKLCSLVLCEALGLGVKLEVQPKEEEQDGSI